MLWRKKVDPLIKNHLELQIRESSKHKRAYLNSKNPSNAQLWIAIAGLSKQIFDLNLKIKFLENTLREIASRGKIKTSKKIKNKKPSIKKSLKKY